MFEIFCHWGIFFFTPNSHPFPTVEKRKKKKVASMNFTLLKRKKEIVDEGEEVSPNDISFSKV